MPDEGVSSACKHLAAQVRYGGSTVEVMAQQIETDVWRASGAPGDGRHETKKGRALWSRRIYPSAACSQVPSLLSYWSWPVWCGGRWRTN